MSLFCNISLIILFTDATMLLVASLVSYSSYVYLPHYMMSLMNSIWSIVSTGEERLEYRYESG